MARGSLLALTGRALYGTHWHAELANALGVSKRAIRRWLAEGHIPPGVWDDLHDLLLDRAAEVERLLQELPRGDVN